MGAMVGGYGWGLWLGDLVGGYGWGLWLRAMVRETVVDRDDDVRRFIRFRRVTIDQ